MHVTHNRALTGRSPGRVASDWAALLPLTAELRPLVRKVAFDFSSLVWWSSHVLGTRIHVSPMSGEWLRMHDTEQTKHGLDV
jgi:hypothetical protein